MNPQQRWQAVSALFHIAAELPKMERRHYLESEGTDPALVEEVLALLERDDATIPLMDSGLDRAAAQLLDHAGDTVDTDESFGPYRIERLLGAGGMGTVFLGRRNDLDKVAAIKILPDAWLSPARRERFLLEQRTLSQLIHPAIAQLYDAGVTRQGTPWFAMEFVDGLPISQYCREKKLTVEERLRLFQEVCDGVRYAHERAVIHRDLKPANILVTADGQPKLLDFGIAKTMNEVAQQTHTELRIMTPAFAAPEQVSGETVGAFTDVYALGVILRMLLTGKEVETAADTPVQPADLDLACRKARDRDPKRRYQSAEALGRDIEHFIRHEPLEARPDSWRYRTEKFLRRNSRAVVATGLSAIAVAAMVIFFVNSLAQARDRAVAQAVRSERIKNLMIHLFQSGTLAGPSADLRAADVLDRGVQEAGRLSADPKTQAEMYQTLADSFVNLGNFDRAEPLLQSALRIRKASFGVNSIPVAETIVALGALRGEQSRFAEARKLIEQGLKVDEKLYPATDAALSRDYFYLGRMLVRSGATREGMDKLNRAIDILSRTGAQPEIEAQSLDALGSAEFDLGDFGKAEATFQRALALERHIYAPSNPLIAEELTNLGSMRFQLGQFPEAERYYRSALDSVRQWYGEDSPYYASVATFLSQPLVKQGHNAEARRLLEKSLAVHERVYGRVSTFVAVDCNALGVVTENMNDWAVAEQYLMRVADINEAFSNGGKQYQFALAHHNLADLYRKSNRLTEAEKEGRIAIAQVKATVPATHMYAGVVRLGLGKTLMAEKQYREAIPYLEESCSILAKQGDPKLWTLLEARKTLAADYQALGRSADAMQLLSSMPK